MGAMMRRREEIRRKGIRTMEGRRRRMTRARTRRVGMTRRRSLKM